MKQVIKLSDGLDSKVYRMYFADVRKFGSQRLWDTLRDYYNTEDPRYVNSLLSSIMDDSKESVDILRNRSSKYSMFATTFFVGSLIGAFSINTTIGLLSISLCLLTAGLSAKASLVYKIKEEIMTSINKGVVSDPNCVYRVLRQYRRDIEEQVKN